MSVMPQFRCCRGIRGATPASRRSKWRSPTTSAPSTSSLALHVAPGEDLPIRRSNRNRIEKRHNRLQSQGKPVTSSAHVTPIELRFRLLRATLFAPLGKDLTQIHGLCPRALRLTEFHAIYRAG